MRLRSLLLVPAVLLGGGLLVPSPSLTAQPIDPALTRTLERAGETFLVAVSPERGVATVSGLLGGLATISPGAGRFEVRLPNGRGGWRETMPEAVEYAISLCFEVRSHLTVESVFNQMLDFVRQRGSLNLPD